MHTPVSTLRDMGSTKKSERGGMSLRLATEDSSDVAESLYKL